jgi:hypothetical protein
VRNVLNEIPGIKLVILKLLMKSEIPTNVAFDVHTIITVVLNGNVIICKQFIPVLVINPNIV